MLWASIADSNDAFSCGSMWALDNMRRPSIASSLFSGGRLILLKTGKVTPRCVVLGFKLSVNCTVADAVPTHEL